MLERESGSRERQRAYIARIRTTATHLMDVVDDLLEVSRLDAGRFPVTLAAARIGRAIEAAVAEVESHAVANTSSSRTRCRDMRPRGSTGATNARSPGAGESAV